MIELRDVRYAWPHAASDCLAIDTLSVGAARTLFLHGPSGAGKSTLLGLLAGVLLPRAGSVSLLGTRWSDLSGSRRDAFRAAFAGFDPAIVAGWGAADVQRLLADAGIIRHRGKIESTIRSAQIYLDIQAAQGFAPFLWAHVGHTPLEGQGDGPPPQAIALSKSLKSRGFKFCGPTITYAFMQAVGMVNDHVITCHRYAAVKS